MILSSPLLLNSITDADETAKGRVVVCGSHGGLYPAFLAAKAGVRAVIFNDAGIGYEDAGIAGVMALGDIGIAAAAADHDSCRIANADDMMARGTISAVNSLAKKLGVAVGESVTDANQKMSDAESSDKFLDNVDETRQVLPLEDVSKPVILVDSASLVVSGDEGAIVITGSHGGLIGGDPGRALKAKAAFAVFNDAGGGLENAGITRLPALDSQQIAAVTIAHTSARIGDAKSALQTGVISVANDTAIAHGIRKGDRLRAALEKL